MASQRKKKRRIPSLESRDIETLRLSEVLFGLFLMLASLLFFISFISYFSNWEVDQSSLAELSNRHVYSSNLLHKFGASVSHFFLYQTFGISSFIIAYFIGYWGRAILLVKNKNVLILNTTWALYYTLWVSLLFGVLPNNISSLGGVIGIELINYITIFIGQIGSIFLVLFLATIFVVFHWKITPEVIIPYFNSFRKTREKETPAEKEELEENSEAKTESIGREEIITPSEKLIIEQNEPEEEEEFETEEEEENNEVEEEEEVNLEMEVETTYAEDVETKNIAQELVNKQGLFDPKLELSNFVFPSLNLLKKYGNGNITISEEELEANKIKIVDTLKNYKIEIAQIKANIGPTVTLYEIVPAAGIRISKIKNLEDDIALSLAALGIRIIAPIPGKGTVGIEVPNQNPSIVSMHSVIASKKFQQSEHDLPIALGKNIRNETFVVDLAKMPHLLMAGATGQGKSVGLNAILSSLLYKKHPAEIKFILVDPKKVELNIYSKIERHYLAKLPNNDDAIITDNTKVINTLNSLCIEMDERYELLKTAMCRNLKEYNTKFKKRLLNPNEGHRYLPYLVLVVDEFADLIMTAGKEVEIPIARLAQLARAIGIHLIIATQRPSVNVITGTIKANFPARIAFRVTSKIDSRTILDFGGADQLIGRGDMLYTQGNDLIRIQCAFIDTPEVENISTFIGSQTGYPDAYQLPEYNPDEENKTKSIDANDRDALFRDAAEVVVNAQQGSTSLIQRKLKIGYNRSGRIIDQLEDAGIVGSFEGSKARQVLISDLVSLDKYLSNETT